MEPTRLIGVLMDREPAAAASHHVDSAADSRLLAAPGIGCRSAA